ncbi:DinB family protein [Arcicella aquatica]|uniref:DinB family protein n=1 Tax=Arcicella aquatica TaxID=217141 RepID=A0ABU5QGI7_9BACT|nr:DinB family protein [Arcicella aquatica]MEA5256171.1 DinB family protein [Arcicella aquatica]
MQLIPFLQKGFALSNSRITKLASLINQEEAFFRPYDKVNHFTWELGHLTFVRNTIIKLLNPSEKLSTFHNERITFAPGTALLEDEMYPPLDSLVATFQQRGERIIALLAEINQERWDIESPYKLPAGNTVGDQVSFFLLHENTHYGEMSYLKNIIVRLRTE